MRERWYGDERDILKWSEVVRVARRAGVQRIVYVPFLPSPQEDPLGERIVPEVWSHFRSIKNLNRLGPKVSLRLDVVAAVFDSNQRQVYISAICGSLRQAKAGRLVLLDPDTGIEPKEANETHVKLSEIKDIWASLRPGDWLAIYQHARRDRSWREEVKNELEEALGVTMESVYNREVAHDAALFFGEKPRQAA